MYIDIAMFVINVVALLYCTLQLEDDVIASAGFVSSVINFASGQTGNWFVIYFSKLGFIGENIYMC